MSCCCWHLPAADCVCDGSMGWTELTGYQRFVPTLYRPLLLSLLVVLLMGPANINNSFPAVLFPCPPCSLYHPCCRPVAGGGGGFKAPLTRMVCTPCYRAPEVVMSRGGYTGVF
jgi:hypothetical protein